MEKGEEIDLNLRFLSPMTLKTIRVLWEMGRETGKSGLFFSLPLAIRQSDLSFLCPFFFARSASPENWTEEEKCGQNPPPFV